jgi:hypothetical protein
MSPSPIYAQHVHATAFLAEGADDVPPGLVLTTAGLSVVRGALVVAVSLSPNDMLVLGTVMARAARLLGADPDAADDILAAIPTAPRCGGDAQPVHERKN